MPVILVALTAVAISIDGFMVGMVYGMRRISLPLSSILVITLTTVGVLFVSLSAGEITGRHLTEGLAHTAGALILMAIGVWGILRVQAGVASQEPYRPRTIWAFRLRSLGIVVQVLREPVRADLDCSGSISYGEAVLLGAALALDALGAGFGAGLAGLEVSTLLLAAGTCSLALVYAGVIVGSREAVQSRAARFGFIPGVVLVLVGLLRLLAA
ncbi:MAG: sporulation membrane protein YtaF [Bacillota bacterium]